MSRQALHLALICFFSLCILSTVACKSLPDDEEAHPYKTVTNLDTQSKNSVGPLEDLQENQHSTATNRPESTTNGSKTDELPALVCLELVQSCPGCQPNESGTRCFARGGIQVMLTLILILAVIGLFGCFCYHKMLMKEVHKLSRTLMNGFGYTAQTSDTLPQEKQAL